jgi:uncharacterized repeat protein (TIGR01451 family)
MADCTLREAILAANDTLEADTITFSLPPSSTIVLGGTVLPFITGTLTMDCSTAENLTISGSDASRIFVIDSIPPGYLAPDESYDYDNKVGSGSFVTMTNLAISGGHESASYGAAILNSGVLILNNIIVSGNDSNNAAVYNHHVLTITNSTFSNNVASQYGGALYNGDGGLVSLSNTTFISNSSTNAGGGAILNADGLIIVKNSTFSHNSAHENNNGGAILNLGFLNVEYSIFDDNESGNGGALFNEILADMSVDNSTFQGNIAAADGGAIYNMNIMIVTTHTFSQNTAGFVGGAIYNSDMTTVVNSTFSQNSATSGGALYNFTNRTMTVLNSTLSGNAVPSFGAGMYNRGTLNLGNTIIANSAGGDDCVNTGTITLNTNNLIEDNSCNPFLSGDPLLGPLQNNGGQTETFALLEGSPALDMGHPATCASPPVNNFDQRGVMRPIDGNNDGNPACDIGSYETNPDFFLVKNAPTLVASGQNITYSLTVTNNLSVTVSNILLTDTLPTNANYVSGGTLIGNVVNWTLSELPAGAGFSRTFVVTATQTITNNDYRVSSDGEYSAGAHAPVVTIVVEPITGLSASNNSPTTVGNPTNLMATTMTGSDVIYSWDFGDGGMGSGQNTSHTYTMVGQYTAVVTATNPLGFATATTFVSW